MMAGIAAVACGCDDGTDSGEHICWDDGLIPPVDAPPPGIYWQARAAVGGGAIQEDAVAAVDGKVYVIGGFTGGGQIVDAVRVYDPATDTWSDAAPLPMAVHHANAAAIGDTLYVLGALTGIGFEPIASAWAYSPATDSWTDLAPLPVARGSAAIGVIDGKIYVAGGLGATGATAAAAVYDPATDTWTAIPPISMARDHLVGAVVDGIFYAIGGRNVDPAAITGRVDAYDPATGVWSPRAAMLTPRGGTAAGVIGSRIYVAGGEGNADDPSGVFPQTEIYDPARDTWTPGPAMLTPRHGTGGAVIANILYVPGGADVQNFGAVDTHEALVMATR